MHLCEEHISVSLLILNTLLYCVLKELDGELTAIDLSANENTFPLRLTAPHIVGVRSLLPPEFPVRSQSPERAKSLSARLGYVMQSPFNNLSRDIKRGRGSNDFPLENCLKSIKWLRYEQI